MELELYTAITITNAVFLPSHPPKIAINKITTGHITSLPYTCAQRVRSGKPPRTPRDVYTTSKLRQVVPGFQNVSADEGRLLPNVLGQRLCLRYGLRRKVHAGDLGAQACPGQRVHPKVTLQVQQALACHRPNFFDLIGGQCHSARLEALNVVEGASDS